MTDTRARNGGLSVVVTGADGTLFDDLPDNAVVVWEVASSDELNNVTKTYTTGFDWFFDVVDDNSAEAKRRREHVKDRIEGLSEDVGRKIIEMADAAFDYLEGMTRRLSGTTGAARLASALHDRSDAGQVATLALLTSYREYFERKLKLWDAKDFFIANPFSFVEFLLFGRSTFAEKSLSGKWNVTETYSRNFLVSLRNSVDPVLPAHLHYGAPLPAVTAEVFRDACRDKAAEVEGRIAEARLAGRPTSRSETFLNKVKKMEEKAEEAVIAINSGQDALVGWKSSKKLSKSPGELLGGKAKKYHSALRSVLSYAATTGSWAVDMSGVDVETLTESRCLAKPFSKKVGRANNGETYRYPLNLVMKKEQFVVRPGTGPEMARIMRDGGPLMLTFPNCQPVEGRRRRLSVSIPLRVTHKIEDILHQFVACGPSGYAGVTVQMLRINVPTGGCRKVTVDITFRGPEECFAAVRHLSPASLASARSALPADPVFGLEDTHKGVDVNDVGPNFLVFDDGLPPSYDIQEVCRKYRAKRRIRSDLCKAKSRNEKTGNFVKARRNGVEIARTYGSMAVARKALHDGSAKELGQRMALSGASNICSEDLRSLNPRGRRGHVAEAAYTMVDETTPHSKALLNLRVADYVYNRNKKEYHHLTTRVRGKKCPHCGSPLRRSRGQYHYVFCKVCKIKVNTHLAEAILVKDQCKSGT